jgi:hypothetical protein
VLLGGDELAEQWLRRMTKSDDWTLRDERRWELRNRLERQLAAALFRAAKGRGRCGKRVPGDLLKAPEAGDTHAADVALALKELLAMAAVRELRTVSILAALSPGTVTLEGCRLTRVCIDVRLQYLRSRIAERERKHWPPRLKDLKRKVHGAGWYFGLRDWQSRYNAACAFALPLTVDRELDPERADELAACALAELRRATAHVDSAFLASKRAWILSEDPDLDGLRADPRFEDFEAVFLPGAAQTPPRPRDVKKLEAARYVRDLLVASARSCERAWHEHGTALGVHPDVHVMLEWWADELCAWRAVWQVARNGRHWRSRLDLIEEMARRGDRAGTAPVEVAFRGYENDPLPSSTRSVVDLANAAEERLGKLDGVLAKLAGDPPVHVLLPDIENLQRRLRDLDAHADEPRWAALEDLCCHHAALWQRLGEWLTVGFGDADAAEQEAFCTALRQTEALWRQTYDAWRGGGRAARRRRFGRTNGARPVAAA